MDIGRSYYNTPLYLYVQTTNNLTVYEIDTENSSVSERGTIPLPAEMNRSKLLYEKEQHNLFVSHGNGGAICYQAMKYIQTEN